MFKKTLVFISIILGTLAVQNLCQAVLVDGHCYLQYQTNHEGTKVLFEAGSPGAVTDSTYTGPTGYYQIDLSVGIYDIYFSHQGYYDQSILDQLILSPTTLITITLEQFPEGIYISGSLSGVLTDTVYVVMGDISVENGDSLFIEPGAVILFYGEYEFVINGYLYCVGTEEDSIWFGRYEGISSWSSIRFEDPSADSSIMKYCFITGAEDFAIKCEDASPTVDNCKISGNERGIACYDFAHPHITNCVIRDNVTDSNFGGVFCSGDARPIFEYCIINCNSAETGGAGVKCGEDSSPVFKNCTICYNFKGGVLCYDSSHPTFEKSIVNGNWSYFGAGNGIKISEYSYPSIINTIVSGNNETGIALYGSLNTSVTYCDIYGNRAHNVWGDEMPPFLGELLIVNSNGDSCDIYFNIFLDPLFVDPQNADFNLLWPSPCIDAGDPASPLDPDGTIADIGAFYYDQNSPLPDIEITLTPMNPPIQIPVSGGSFDFNVTVINNDFISQSFEVWIMAQLPDSTWHGPVQEPALLYFDAFSNALKYSNPRCARSSALR